MAKVQKNFMIDENLAALIDRVLELSGMNFTTFATAALLQALFDRCAAPEIGTIIGPDATWIGLASRLQQGRIKVGDIPTELLKDAVYLAKSALADPEHHRDGDKPGWIEIQKRLVRDRETEAKAWKHAVDESGDGLKAALSYIDDYYNVK